MHLPSRRASRGLRAGASARLLLSSVAGASLAFAACATGTGAPSGAGGDESTGASGKGGEGGSGGGTTSGTSTTSVSSSSASSSASTSSSGGGPATSSTGAETSSSSGSPGTCGDGQKNQTSEQCDGFDLDGADCAKATGVAGSTGSVDCQVDCTFDTSQCTGAPTCGDGQKNQASEECDASDLGGATCDSVVSGTAGKLACTAGCKLDASGCLKAGPCGDGKLNAGEECDDGNGDAGDGCEGCKVVCLPDEVEYAANHHCYLEAGPYKTWQDAQAACASAGGYLAVANDGGENDFLFFSVMTPADEYDGRWIGFSDIATEGKFVAASGEAVGYTDWASGEPNNLGNEDCVEHRYDFNEWNDEGCSSTRLFLCEFPPPVKLP